MIRTLILLSLIFCSLFSNSLDISNLKNLKSLDYTYFIQDKENRFTYEDINKKEDLEKLKVMHIGGAKGPFWTKISLVNNSNEPKAITLYNPLAGINEIDSYLLKDNNLIKTLYLGDLREQNLRDNLTIYSNINLVLNPKANITIISKIENFYMYNLGWEIQESADFFTQSSQKIFFAGLIGGIVILFSIYNILNSILYKNKTYLIICAIAIILGLYQYGFHGIIYFLDIGINLELITAITWNSSSLGGIFILLFAYTHFEQAKKYKIASYINLFFILCFAILTILLIYAQFFNEDYFKFSSLIALVVLASTLYLFLFAIYVVYKKETGAIFYLIGEGTLFIVIIFNTLGLFNLISYDYNIKFLIPFAYLVNLISLVTVLYLKNKENQEALRKSRILLIEQSRFSSVGQAVGHISHQWKTPLTSIGTSITDLSTLNRT